MITVVLRSREDLHRAQWEQQGGAISFARGSGADICLVVNTPTGRADAHVGDTLTITGRTCTVTKTVVEQGSLW